MYPTNSIQSSSFCLSKLSKKLRVFFPLVVLNRFWLSSNSVFRALIYAKRTYTSSWEQLMKYFDLSSWTVSHWRLHFFRHLVSDVDRYLLDMALYSVVKTRNIFLLLILLYVPVVQKLATPSISTWNSAFFSFLFYDIYKSMVWI